MKTTSTDERPEAIRLSERLQYLIQSADNLELEADGSLRSDQLKALEHTSVSLSELRWSSQKTSMIDEVVKGIKEQHGWQTCISWAAKDFVLEHGTLFTPSGSTCIVVPAAYPGQPRVLIHTKDKAVASLDWASQNTAYKLDSGLGIRALEGAIRFYAIMFKTPEA
ncbi:hypothetical protein CGMCC3_g9867 [Colletotrichum fructicola]|nr:uncharacterized protein CGMCC3_g9867 [Colletotrichum fructicola]KAE9574179.1 hypothetical protein CGMCC3_g9867 [Colletotrichum fructicola]